MRPASRMSNGCGGASSLALRFWRILRQRPHLSLALPALKTPFLVACPARSDTAHGTTRVASLGETGYQGDVSAVNESVTVWSWLRCRSAAGRTARRPSGKASWRGPHPAARRIAVGQSAKLGGYAT